VYGSIGNVEVTGKNQVRRIYIFNSIDYSNENLNLLGSYEEYI